MYKVKKGLDGYTQLLRRPGRVVMIAAAQKGETRDKTPRKRQERQDTQAPPKNGRSSAGHGRRSHRRVSSYIPAVTVCHTFLISYQYQAVSGRQAMHTELMWLCIHTVPLYRATMARSARRCA